MKNEARPIDDNALTLEQLRGMLENDGEIIGTAIIVSENGVLSHGILDCSSDDGVCASISASQRWLKEKDYGKTWLSYAYPHAHIDREAWDPCHACKSKQCFNCWNDDLSMNTEPCRSCTGNEWRAKYKFCPECGRPMTEEAWAELEKRLRG